MAIEIRPWPDATDGNPKEIGGEDAGEDLVIHYVSDGQPRMWEIEHASEHREHIVTAPGQIPPPKRRRRLGGELINPTRRA